MLNKLNILYEIMKDTQTCDNCQALPSPPQQCSAHLDCNALDKAL